MDLGIGGRVAVVSGGARGSGLVIGQRLAAEGVRIVLSGRDPEMVRAAEERIRASGGEAVGVVGDAVAPDMAERLREAAEANFGPVGICVMNYASLSSNARSFMEITDQELEDSYQTYFLAIVRMMRAVLPGMKAQQWGRVILLGSGNMKNPSVVDPLTAQSVRVAGALLLKNLTFEYSEHNISFNTLAIGAFKTALAMDYLKTAPQGSYQAYADQVPMKRWAEPEELAALVTWLCGEESAYVNGEVIRIDGGQTHSLF